MFAQPRTAWSPQASRWAPAPGPRGAHVRAVTESTSGQGAPQVGGAMAVDAPAQPMLAVKQFIPPVRPGAVPRGLLADQLTSARTRLTLVVAPAGWGKTSLLSAWAREPCAGQQVAWVSLDDGDDEPRRFWRYVLSALGDASDEVSSAPLEAMEGGDRAVLDLALPLLLNELARSTADHVLILDDYHTVTDQRIHEAMEFLLAYLPPSLRIVIAGRFDPPLPLA